LQKSGGLSQSIVFRVSDEPIHTCVSGDWKRLEVVRAPDKLTLNPAYSVQGRNVEILLSTGLCDSYNEFVGELSDQGFSGVHRYSGLRASQEYGKVFGTEAAPKQ